ncbi:MAG: hypothetical protein MJ147_06550 [Clostridia bacterium]|nr:hypothetical protein [Clostridia bacterium]
MSDKKVSLKKMIRVGGYLRNPVLVHVIGICPVAAAATSLFNSLVLAGVFTVSLIICEVLASLIMKKMPRWLRVSIYVIINTGIVFPVMYYLEKNQSPVFASLGIYLPLMAMNSFTCIHSEKYAVKHSVKESFFDAIASSIGYSAVLLLVGIIREIVGSGKIAGFDIPFISGLNGALMPFGGLFIIGILAALHKARVIKNYPKQARTIEKKFTLDESREEEGTFTYNLKNRFKKNEENF